MKQKEISKRVNEEIETLCDLLIEAPIEDFKDWFENNKHIEKEISYTYGFIQAFVEMKLIVLDEKQEQVFVLMTEYFDSI